MSILEVLRGIEESVKEAEDALLQGDTSRTHELLDEMSQGPLASVAQFAHERKLEFDEARYVKISFQGRATEYRFEHDATFDEGYPSIRTPFERKKGTSWYTERVDIDDYAERFADTLPALKKPHRLIDALEARRHPEDDPPPVNERILEFSILSSIRLGLRRFWENLVMDVIRSRHRTPLEPLAKVLDLRMTWVCDIAKRHRPTSYPMGGVPDELDWKEMTYYCTDPDFSLVPLVDLPEPPEAKVVYLVVCPNCRHRNQQGNTTCANCGAPL